MLRASIISIGILLWLCMAGAGLWKLLSYEKTPGQVANKPAQWPKETRIPLARDRATLVVFAHPHCPCTRATLDELDRLIAECQGRLTAVVVMYQPKATGAEWSHSDLWARAERIPGVVVRGDSGGEEALRFGARTSGLVMLFGPNGHRRFAGGITSGRGHAGDNDGHSAVREAVLTGSAPTTSAPVFGCSLSSNDRPFQSDNRRDLDARP
jgi:hypothetical protein